MTTTTALELGKMLKGLGGLGMIFTAGAAFFYFTGAEYLKTIVVSAMWFSFALIVLGVAVVTVAKVRESNRQKQRTLDAAISKAFSDIEAATVTKEYTVEFEGLAYRLEARKSLSNRVRVTIYKADSPDSELAAFLIYSDDENLIKWQGEKVIRRKVEGSRKWAYGDEAKRMRSLRKAQHADAGI